MKTRKKSAMYRLCIGLTGVILVLMLPPGAHAQEVAFTVMDGPYFDAELNRLTLDSGELTPVGPIGHSVTHIAFDSQGSLFGVDAMNDQLLAIGINSGSGAPVGSLGQEISWVEGLTFNAENRLWMIAMDDVLGSSLFEIDRATGEASWIAGIAEPLSHGLASHEGTVYIAGNALAALDTADGSVTLIPGSTLGIWWARALDFDDLGIPRGLLLCGPCMSPFDILIVNSIDPDSGTLTNDSFGAPHGSWGLAILQGSLFLDGFETGATGVWSANPSPIRIDRSPD